LGLQYAITTHPRIKIDIILSPSYFLIPNGGKYTKNESVLVVSLGQLILRTEPRPLNQRSVKTMHTEGANSDEILNELILQSYDKFEFEIQNMQVIVAKHNEDWEDVISIGKRTKMHILEPSFFKIVASLSVITDDPRLPKYKIECELPSINVSVTEDRFLDMISIVVNLPLPESEQQPFKPISRDSNLIGSSLSLLKYLDEKQQKLQKRIDPPPESLDSTDSFVQFTEIEINFVLQEFTITICKSKIDDDTFKNENESSSDEFGTPDEFDPENFVSPSFKSIQLDIIDKEDDNRDNMLFVKMEKFELKAVQKSYELNIDLKLGAISFDQFRTKNSQQKKVQVINTPRYDSSEYLFTLNYVNCKKTSPEFFTKYQSCEQIINFKMSTILLLLNQEGIGELIMILSNLQDRSDKIISSKAKPRDRIADANELSILEVAKKKLPIILEESYENDYNSSNIIETSELNFNSILQFMS
jgi:vacuolar protein sorting-associated protein 13A/C